MSANPYAAVASAEGATTPATLDIVNDAGKPIRVHLVFPGIETARGGPYRAPAVEFFYMALGGQPGTGDPGMWIDTVDLRRLPLGAFPTHVSIHSLPDARLDETAMQVVTSWLYLVARRFGY